jgi:hypothetical protein
MIIQIFGSYYIERFMDKGERRILKAKESGYDWVLTTLGHRTDCYKMFRMYPPVFHVGEFKKTRHPRNVELNKVLKACFSGAGNSRFSEAWNL